LAGETGTQGSEFPIFKSGEGAFDRAKYKEQERATVTSSGQITGKEIDEDLKKKKKSADDVIKEANKFYNEEFQKNIKALDPAYDSDLVYYEKAYSGDSSDRSNIKRKIEDGEALDGKEISEMSKKTAENKLGNAQILKTGNVTQIVENLGIKNVKEYGKYDSVKEEFDSKITDENFKFDSLLKKFSSILSVFNDSGPMASQTASALYTPENNSIISALAKILEGEGFNNESVLAMSKRYDENLGKLIDKSKDGAIESMKMTKEGDVVAATGPTGTVSETKLEEKKEPTGTAAAPTVPTVPTEPTTSTSSSIESTKNITGSPVGTTGPAVSSAETKLGEAKSGMSPTGTTGSSVKEQPIKLEDKNLDDKYNSMIKDLFGIDLSATGGTGPTGGTGGTGKAETDIEKLTIKKGEDLFGPFKGGTGSTGGTGSKEPEKKKDETKLETKIDKKNEKINETLPVSVGKKETATQNLSSVSTPVEKPKEAETTTNNTNNTSTASTSSAEGDTKSSSTETTKSEATSNEKKGEENKKEGTDNKEMLETMKNMVSLLSQLNSTMQGPLIVTPTNKKFQ
jgi:hypothetical protein